MEVPKKVGGPGKMGQGMWARSNIQYKLIVELSQGLIDPELLEGNRSKPINV